MAHYKNRRPKAFKGHCAMCTEGRGRCQRALTMQERRAPEPDVAVAIADQQAEIEDLVYGYCFCESCCGVCDEPCREQGPENAAIIVSPPLRAPLLASYGR